MKKLLILCALLLAQTSMAQGHGKEISLEELIDKAQTLQGEGKEIAILQLKQVVSELGKYVLDKQQKQLLEEAKTLLYETWLQAQPKFDVNKFEFSILKYMDKDPAGAENIENLVDQAWNKLLMKTQSHVSEEADHLILMSLFAYYVDKTEHTNNINEQRETAHTAFLVQGLIMGDMKQIVDEGLNFDDVRSYSERLSKFVDVMPSIVGRSTELKKLMSEELELRLSTLESLIRVK